MNGKLLAGGLAVFALGFGGALWWFQTQAWYDEITGVEAVDVQGSDLPVVNYRGLDGDSSPLKLRACFRVRDGVAPDALAHVKAAEGATPLVAPDWFDCFDAPWIQAELDGGEARAVLAAANEPWGFDRYIAYMPDGRGWMWRQMNHCGHAVFDGKDLPEGCPPKPE
ncbi:DUF6446 family protein [Rhodovulum sp. DZ06]|uniref:DUF6446 family protein n=1 Tax=Rhodovulum sp. DZ06 TaxID=3425126 RepID=UPI003D325A4A